MFIISVTVLYYKFIFYDISAHFNRLYYAPGCWPKLPAPYHHLYSSHALIELAIASEKS